MAVHPGGAIGAVGLPERATQDRVVALFRHELGCRYLDSLAHEVNNSKVEEPIVSAYLRRNGYAPAQISRAILRLRTEASNSHRGPQGPSDRVRGVPEAHRRADGKDPARPG